MVAWCQHIQQVRGRINSPTVWQVVFDKHSQLKRLCRYLESGRLKRCHRIQRLRGWVACRQNQFTLDWCRSLETLGCSPFHSHLPHTKIVNRSNSELKLLGIKQNPSPWQSIREHCGGLVISNRNVHSERSLCRQAIRICPIEFQLSRFDHDFRLWIKRLVRYRDFISVDFRGNKTSRRGRIKGDSRSKNNRQSPTANILCNRLLALKITG